jgi:ATP-dependent DNA ligase
VCGRDGIASFERIRYRHHDATVFLYAFDLIELGVDDLRRDTLAVRNATLASLLSRASLGLRNEGLADNSSILSRGSSLLPWRAGGGAMPL